MLVVTILRVATDIKQHQQLLFTWTVFDPTWCRVALPQYNFIQMSLLRSAFCVIHNMHLRFMEVLRTGNWKFQNPRPNPPHRELHCCGQFYDSAFCAADVFAAMPIQAK